MEKFDNIHPLHFSQDTLTSNVRLAYLLCQQIWEDTREDNPPALRYVCVATC